MPNRTRKQPPRPDAETGIYPRWSPREWQWVFDAVANVDGKQHWSRGHATKPLARIARAEMQVSASRGLMGKAPARLTVGDLVTKHWLLAKQAELRNKNSLAGLKFAERYLVAGLGKHRLAKLTPGLVEGWKRDLVTSGMKSSTAAHLFYRLKEVLKWAADHEMIYRNVSGPVRAPRVVAHRPPEIDLDTVRKLFAVAERFGDDGLPVYLAAMTGMREQSELFALRWSQADLGAGTISVAAKTPSGRRAIAIGPETVARLQKHRQAQIARYYDLELPPPPLVLVQDTGRPWTTARYWWKWNAIREAAGLPSMHFHDLRHVRATLLARAGVHPRVMQDALGHASPVISLQVYTHTNAGQQVEAAAAVETLLKQPGGQP